MAERTFGFRTRALHAGGTPDAEHGARAVPIYQSTSFVFKDTDDAANLFALQKYGNIYSRIGNPTVAAFEERIASLEGGIGAVATSSGMAAEFITFAALAGAGDHIVASSKLYGGTITQLDVTLRRFGVDTTFIDSTDPADFAAAIGENTKAVYTEIVANPSGDIADLEGLAKVAHDAGIPLVVDATLSTPYLIRPIEHGADIVIHSATKFLGGHGTTLGGVVVESGRFNWGNGKFPQMTEPVPSYGNVSWWGNFGEYGFLTKLRSEQLRDIGPSLSAQSAFQLLQGVETLPQRMDEHLANARRVAEWLEADERVSWVNYAGLPSHPHHERGRKYLPQGVGSVFSFGVKGGRVAGQKFIESLQLASHLANIGDARTLVLHPGSTTHQQLTADQMVAAGVPEDLIRISVGLEDVEDILWDLDQALAESQQAGAEHGPSRDHEDDVFDTSEFASPTYAGESCTVPAARAARTEPGTRVVESVEELVEAEEGAAK
ncbi:O-acetylhomoserine aminocarboxypropyltransferase/cysteine synthase family protein [Arthrobacter mangrovi]|uniref:O-acetylhomoserine aminocarboxypropyltransferase n=1 Tax=Arthrobacter mangrovi TaxID=2966350 RepID=A0ABQ5MVR7_9MICC|nr:O-acetylhomoserine aminocarboxypropyltransferase/cysteine synthase family protein [Arthrobacter mangrovi]GLB68040.1 O-acetylhomoserine aminocarboxypropyltransferase [Arthrobacter mangrovi]